MARLKVNANIIDLRPGDKVMSPRGEVMHEVSKIVLPGSRLKSFGFALHGTVIAVLVHAPGTNTLIYCDREGRKHEEPIPGWGIDQVMHNAVQRVSKLVAVFLGQRHPLADAPSANEAAA